MEKIKKIFAHRFFKVILKIFKWAFLLLLAGYIVLVIFRTIHLFNVDKTDAQVVIIHSTKLQISDVTGENLPPDPGIEADKTVEGVDVNKNGIRDDVELAIFEKYPNSAKTRAALLQYALVEQMILTQPFVNTVIATEVLREDSRADSCLADSLVPRKTPESFRTTNEMNKISEYISFIQEKQFNTEKRKINRDSFFEKLRSYSDLDIESCDINYS